MNTTTSMSEQTPVYYYEASKIFNFFVICKNLIILLLATFIFLVSNVYSADLIKSDINSDKCIQKQNDGWANGNIIHISDCNTGKDENKVWRFDETTGYIRSAIHPEKCLHKRFRGWANGNPIHIWDCDASRGRPGMKTWVFDEDTGYIHGVGREGTSKCFHKREGGWANGNPIHIWDCDAARRNPEMKTWDLVPYLYTNPDCDQVNSLGSALAPEVLEAGNSQLRGEYRLNRRKTLQIHSVESVTVSDCRIQLNLNITLKRKIRRDAHGTMRLSSRINSISESEVCLSDVNVDDVNVSRTGIIGESVYRWAANIVLPNNRCFPIDITM